MKYLYLTFAFCFLLSCNRGNNKTYDIKVTKAFTKVESNSDKASTSVYMINAIDLYTNERLEFQVVDDVITGHWTSGDIFSQIDVGKCYRVKSFGKRNRFWSWYPKIREEVVEISCGN